MAINSVPYGYPNAGNSVHYGYPNLGGGGAGYTTIQPNTIPPREITLTFHDSVMLRVAPDGFYVRGEKLKQDENEARAVFDAFSAWLTIHTLSR